MREKEREAMSEGQNWKRGGSSEQGQEGAAGHVKSDVPAGHSFSHPGNPPATHCAPCPL